MNRQANASAKSKELHPHPQTDIVAAHLILPNALRTTLTKKNYHSGKTF
jgi:hypothetical protein